MAYRNPFPHIRPSVPQSCDEDWGIDIGVSTFKKSPGEGQGSNSHRPTKGCTSGGGSRASHQGLQIENDSGRGGI